MCKIEASEGTVFLCCLLSQLPMVMIDTVNDQTKNKNGSRALELVQPVQPQWYTNILLITLT